MTARGAEAGWRARIMAEAELREEAWDRYRRTKRVQAVVSAVLAAIAAMVVLLSVVG